MRHYQKAPRPLSDAPATTSPFIRAPRMMSDHQSSCGDGAVCALCSVMGAQGACVCASQPVANISSLQRWRRRYSTTRTHRGARWIKPTPKAEADTTTWTVTELRTDPHRIHRERETVYAFTISTCSPQRATRGQLQPVSLVLKGINLVYIHIEFCLKEAKKNKQNTYLSLIGFGLISSTKNESPSFDNTAP